MRSDSEEQKSMYRRRERFNSHTVKNILKKARFLTHPISMCTWSMYRETPAAFMCQHGECKSDSSVWQKQTLKSQLDLTLLKTADCILQVSKDFISLNMSNLITKKKKNQKKN